MDAPSTVIVCLVQQNSSAKHMKKGPTKGRITHNRAGQLEEHDRPFGNVFLLKIEKN